MSSRHWTLALLGAIVLTVVFAWAAVVKLSEYAGDVQRALQAAADAQKPTSEKLAGDLFKGLAMAAGFVLSAVFAGGLMLRRGFGFRHPTTYLFLLAGVVVLIHQIGVRDWLFVTLGAVMVIYGVGDLAICLKNHVHSTGKVTVDQVAGL
jgi:hypothetical protein